MEKEVFDKLSRRLIDISLLVYIFSVILLAYLSNTDLGLVFVATLPLLLYLIILFLTFFYRLANNLYVWLLPLFFPLMFFFIWNSGNFELLNKMEGPTIMVLNILISYFVNFLLIMFYVREGKKPKNHEQSKQENNQATQHQNNWATYYSEQKRKYLSEIHRLRNTIANMQHDVKITEKNFNVTLRSIEDKCKAINFVIGRVYSDKRGGSLEVREKLKIDNELYNSFSELTANFKKEDGFNLMQLLDKIYNKLLQFDMIENKIISLNKNPEIVIERDLEGREKIIEVMARNDKDPIKDYLAEAKEICLKVKEYVKNHISRMSGAN